MLLTRYMVFRSAYLHAMTFYHVRGFWIHAAISVRDENWLRQCKKKNDPKDVQFTRLLFFLCCHSVHHHNQHHHHHWKPMTQKRWHVEFARQGTYGLGNTGKCGSQLR